MTSGAWIGMGIALAVLCAFVSLTDDTLLSPSLLYGETKGEELPDQAPAGCENCQDALDKYWDLKNSANELPYTPPYLQDEIDTARQAYLDCIAACDAGPEPTPEPTKEPSAMSVSLSGPAETVVDCVTSPIEAEVRGGVKPYTYEWSSSASLGGSGGPAVSFISHEPGNQWARLTVEDANDATASALHKIRVNVQYSVSSGISRSEYGDQVQVSDEYVGADPGGSTITFTITRSHIFSNRIDVEMGIPVSIITAKVQYQGDRSYNVTSATAQQYYVPAGETRALFARSKSKKTTGRVRHYICNSDYEEGDWRMEEFECWEWKFKQP